jgi:hypothetical protein
MQMQVMQDVRVMIQEVERRLKAVPPQKFDPTYLEESIEMLKKQIVARMDRSEANTQNDIISIRQDIGEQRQ